MKQISMDKKLELLSYAESIAVRYYTKHKEVYEKDAVSVKDLIQEAKRVCLEMIRDYGSKEGKNNFNIKKFAGRAVGWKMNVMLKGAIIHSKNTSSIEENKDTDIDRSSTTNEVIEYNQWVKDDYFDTLSPDLLFGFNIEEVYKQFEGKDLTILKKMIEYRSIKSIQKELGYKNNNSIRTVWQERILPKLKVILKNSLNEYRP